MKAPRFFPILVTALALFGALAPQAARSADVLYIGDEGDNTIKRFAANTGKFLGVSQGPSISGLAGPRGLVVDGGLGLLLVVNQNVLLDIPGEVLRYDPATLEFKDRLIPSSNPNAPFAPDGLVLGAHSGLSSVTSCPPSAQPMSCDLFVAVVQRNANLGPPGSVARYNGVGMFLGAATVQNNSREHHPRGVVFGPDGLLYVSARDLTNGLGGTVLRFSADGKSEVFIDDQGGAGHLNRPDGLVFGPDGRLYVTSFQAAPGDTDSIRIYDAQGAFAAKIDLDNGTDPRTYAQSLLFGPGGSLFVPINTTGEVRRYDHVRSCPGPKCDETYTTFIPAHGDLLMPRYMTFGNTDRSTLEYPK
jgi:DNA-binding beta-propeller fold protein YncE